MAIAEQFAGLNMDHLIGAPLKAAADASTQLANSTADFINRVGFDNEGNVRNVTFGYQSRTVNEDGSSNLDEMKVAVPMLAIVPIPNLQVDEVNVLFDMEVKQSEKKESGFDMGASLSGSAKLGFIQVSVTGSVSAHQSNTRSSDNSAKYHVDVRASNHGTPEGLARVLDMMAANVAPMLVGSTLKDENGQTLSGQAKARAERLKTLRSEISRIEKCLGAASDGLSSSIMMFKKVASVQQNEYMDTLVRKQNDETDEAKKLTYNQTMDEINQSWNGFQNQAGDIVKMLAASSETTEGLSTMFSLKALNKDNQIADYSQELGKQYEAMKQAQNRAVECQKNVNKLENELFDKKLEYSDAMSGHTAALPSKTGETAVNTGA